MMHLNLGLMFLIGSPVAYAGNKRGERTNNKYTSINWRNIPQYYSLSTSGRTFDPGLEPLHFNNLRAFNRLNSSTPVASTSISFVINCLRTFRGFLPASLNLFQVSSFF
jgi:hypothetical protein